MSEIDKLIVKIEADTKQLKSELNQIQGKIRVTGAAGGAAFAGMGAAITKVKGPLLAAGAGLVAFGALGKVVGGVGSQFEDLKDSLDVVFGSMEAGDRAMDKVFEFAQTTPFQIEDATKAFIALKSSGIEPSMEMLQTFADTASTSIDQLGAFEALIRIVQRSAAGGMGLEEINQLDDRGIPATKILTEALGKSREELSEFGKTAEGAAQMVKILTDGLQERFGGAMENKMDNLSTKTSNMVIAFKQLADEVFKSGLGDFLKGMADRLTDMANAISRTVRRFKGDITAKDVGITETDPRKQLELLDKQIEADKKRAETLEKTRPSGAGTRDGVIMSHNNKELDLARDITNKEALRLEILQQIADLEEKTVVTKTSKSTLLQTDIEFMSEFKKLLEDSVPEVDQIQAQMDKVTAMKGKLGEDGKLIASDAEIQRILDFLDKAQKELNETETVSEQMQQTIINASNAFTTDFVNALMNGESALASFKDFAKNIVSQIISIFLQMGVVNEILNAVFGFTGTDNELDTLRNSAGGGTAQRGQAMVVGERGPELFIPHSNGNILNNMNSKNAGGGSTIVVNQSVNFATGVVPTVRAEVTKMMPQIAEVTKGAVADAALRGGSFRKALQGG